MGKEYQNPQEPLPEVTSETAKAPGQNKQKRQNMEPEVPVLAPEILPCPHFLRGHCKNISNRKCKLSHNAQTCWNDSCKQPRACGMRHPRACHLFFRSVRGCHRQSCNYKYLPPPEASVVLMATGAPAGDAPRIDVLYQKIAVQHVQMSELHERLAAQEVLTNNLLNKISEL